MPDEQQRDAAGQRNAHRTARESRPVTRERFQTQVRQRSGVPLGVSGLIRGREDANFFLAAELVERHADEAVVCRYAAEDPERAGLKRENQLAFYLYEEKRTAFAAGERATEGFSRAHHNRRQLTAKVWKTFPNKISALDPMPLNK